MTDAAPDPPPERTGRLAGLVLMPLRWLAVLIAGLAWLIVVPVVDLFLGLARRLRIRD